MILGKDIGNLLVKTTVGTEKDAYKVAEAIEKMIGTAANSTDREQAKKELVNALLRK